MERTTLGEVGAFVSILENWGEERKGFLAPSFFVVVPSDFKIPWQF